MHFQLILILFTHKNGYFEPKCRVLNKNNEFSISTTGNILTNYIFFHFNN